MRRAGLLLALPLLLGADWYVDDGGTGSSPCTTGDPCSPATMAGLSPAAGDVVYFKAGAYTVSDIVAQSGSAGNQIRYVSEVALAAIVTGGTLPNTYNNYTFEQFYVDATTSETGLTVDADNISILNCEIAGNDVGIGDGPVGDECSEDRSSGGPAVWGAGVTILSGADGIVVDGNVVHGFNDSGVNTPCTSTSITISDNYFYKNFGSCLSYNNTSGTVDFTGNVCWNIPNHIMEIGNTCDGNNPSGTLNITGNLIVAGQEAWEGYSGATINLTNNTFYMMASSVSCGIEGGGMGLNKDRDAGCIPGDTCGDVGACAECIPNVVGPFTFKNNLYASDRTNDRDSTWYAMLSTPAYTSWLSNSDYNWLWRQDCETFGSCATITTDNYRWYNIDADSTINNLAAWTAASGFDSHSGNGDPGFADPTLDPEPANLAAAFARLTPSNASVCTGGEGGTYIGAVDCGAAPTGRLRRMMVTK